MSQQQPKKERTVGEQLVEYWRRQVGVRISIAIPTGSAAAGCHFNGHPIMAVVLGVAALGLTVNFIRIWLHMRWFVNIGRKHEKPC